MDTVLRKAGMYTLKIVKNGRRVGVVVGVVEPLDDNARARFARCLSGRYMR